MEIVKAIIVTGAGKAGKQIVMEEMLQGKTVIEVGHRGANKTPVEQQIIMADFTELEERVLAAMKNEVYRQPLEKLVRPYQRRLIAAVAAVYRQEKKKESQSAKSKAKGPRNRWGGVSCKRFIFRDELLVDGCTECDDLLIEDMKVLWNGRPNVKPLPWIDCPIYAFNFNPGQWIVRPV